MKCTDGNIFCFLGILDNIDGKNTSERDNTGEKGGEPPVLPLPASHPAKVYRRYNCSSYFQLTGQSMVRIAVKNNDFQS